MDENNINAVLKMLRKSTTRSDWDLVYEAIEYLEEYVEDTDDDESSY